jgi:hypothetical protein
MSDVVVQRILRHANVSTTTGYYIMTAAPGVRNAMTKKNSTAERPSDTEQHFPGAATDAAVTANCWDGESLGRIQA